jgi:putative SOS response-associated peptidase YedK
MRWGLIPSWTASDQLNSGPPMINARCETLGEKPTFRTPFRRRRCLIPADGFYEWQQSAGGARGKKQPYFIHRPDHGPFAFAGLWDRWVGQGDGAMPTPNPSSNPFLNETGSAHRSGLTIESCTIVTTNANRTLKDLHDRMPVMLAPCDYAVWLDPKIDDPAALQHLLAPCGEEELIAEPVSTHVNKVTNDDPRCITIQRSLF